MDFEFQTGMCSKCKGIDKCTNSCILHLGKALVDFIERVDTTETRIGDYEHRDYKHPGTKPDLVVNGHRIFDLESPDWLLSDISKVVDISDKFEKAFDKNAFQIATMYCKAAGYDSERTKKITDRIKNINACREIVIPFKPKTNCNIDIDTENIKAKKKDAVISYVKWKADDDTHKLKCTIGFKTENAFNSGNTIVIDAVDYLDKFRISQIDIKNDGTKKNNELIKITDIGIFRPIVVKDKDYAIAVDGTFLYTISSDGTEIAGFWNDKNELIIDKKLKNKTVDIIKRNKDLIKEHKKYMAPYLLFKANVVEL